MPRIRAESSKLNNAAAAYPREFAILSQIASKGDQYEIDSEALKKLGQALGDEAAVAKIAAAGEVDVEDFITAFQKPLEVAGATGEGNCIGWAAQDTTGILAPFKFERRAVKEFDVKFRLTHCGICHSDLHQIRGEWGNSTYPMVPGHELAGIVVEVGPGVKKFKIGDKVGVGCMVDACFECDKCGKGEQQFCRKGSVMTYNGVGYDGVPTQGGYSSFCVVDEKCVLRIPDNLPLDKAAPLLCAGITTYSPLKYYGLDKPGTKVAVNGLGGLGHMAVKFGVAMGLEVTVLSRSKSKEAEAKALGAHHYLVSTDPEAIKAAKGTFEGIIDTVSAEHDTQLLVDLLDTDGKLVLVGAPPTTTIPASQLSLLMKRVLIGGSLIGGIPETQEMLDFCGEKNVSCEIELIPISYVNKAMERLEKGDVKFRFVIDIQGSLP